MTEHDDDYVHEHEWYRGDACACERNACTKYCTQCMATDYCTREEYMTLPVGCVHG